MVKKTLFNEYDCGRQDGLIAINLREGDELVAGDADHDGDEILHGLARPGRTIRFSEDRRAAHGPHGQRRGA